MWTNGIESSNCNRIMIKNFDKNMAHNRNVKNNDKNNIVRRTFRLNRMCVGVALWATNVAKTFMEHFMSRVVQ